MHEQVSLRELTDAQLEALERFAATLKMRAALAAIPINTLLHRQARGHLAAAGGTAPVSDKAKASR